MLLANIAARGRGLLSEAGEAFMRDRMLLPLINKAALKFDLTGEHIIQGMKKDKKRTGAKLALVMAMDGFKMQRANDLDEKEAAAAIGELGGYRL